MILHNISHYYNTYSFDCYTAVFFRQKYKTSDVQLYSQFYGGCLQHSWGIVDVNATISWELELVPLTDGGHTSGGVSDVAVARCLMLGLIMSLLGRSFLGGPTVEL